MFRMSLVCGMKTVIHCRIEWHGAPALELWPHVGVPSDTPQLGPATDGA